MYGKNSEPFFHQNFCGRERLNRIGQQVARVWMNLELDPRRQTCTRRQAREAHGLLRISGAAGVWQKQKTFGIDKVENVRERVVFA